MLGGLRPSEPADTASTAKAPIRAALTRLGIVIVRMSLMAA